MVQAFFSFEHWLMFVLLVTLGFPLSDAFFQRELVNVAVLHIV